MFGKLKPTEIEQVLKAGVIGHLASHADDRTYIVPISYAYDGTYVYGHTHEGLKVNMMRKNPMVCFEVDDTRDMANWKSVIAWGDFEELPKGARRKKALRQLLNRQLPPNHSETVELSDEFPFMPEDTNTIEGVVFRIKLEEKTGRFESNSVAPLLA